MGRVELGLVLPENPRHPPRRDHYMADLGRLLASVKGQFASAWCIDHLGGDVLEGWTTVAYLAAIHPELVWGHTVLSNGFRNPALVARMGATLAYLSGGRYVLGIGAGGDAAEHLAFGYEFPRGERRMAALDEALSIIREMWTRERVTFAGAHYRVTDASCEPRPVPPPPIAVGAFGPKMLRLTARQADWWNVSSTATDDYRRLVEEMERACDEIRRDPTTLRRVWSGGCACAPTEAGVARLAAGRLEAGEDIAGTPAQVIDQMQSLVELGVDCFLIDCGGFPDLTTVETLIDGVLPALNR